MIRTDDSYRRTAKDVVIDCRHRITRNDPPITDDHDLITRSDPPITDDHDLITWSDPPITHDHDLFTRTDPLITHDHDSITRSDPRDIVAHGAVTKQHVGFTAALKTLLGRSGESSLRERGRRHNSRSQPTRAEGRARLNAKLSNLARRFSRSLPVRRGALLSLCLSMSGLRPQTRRRSRR
jgi:hypothetical protein